MHVVIKKNTNQWSFRKLNGYELTIFIFRRNIKHKTWFSFFKNCNFIRSFQLLYRRSTNLKIYFPNHKIRSLEEEKEKKKNYAIENKIRQTIFYFINLIKKKN